MYRLDWKEISIFHSYSLLRQYRDFICQVFELWLDGMAAASALSLSDRTRIQIVFHPSQDSAHDSELVHDKINCRYHRFNL